MFCSQGHMSRVDVCHVLGHMVSLSSLAVTLGALGGGAGNLWSRYSEILVLLFSKKQFHRKISGEIANFPFCMSYSLSLGQESRVWISSAVSLLSVQQSTLHHAILQEIHWRQLITHHSDHQYEFLFEHVKFFLQMWVNVCKYFIWMISNFQI